MPLQLDVLSRGVEHLAHKAADVANLQMLGEARQRLREVDGLTLRAKIQSRDPRFPWLTAIPTNDTMGASYSIPYPSPPFSVAASDGSNIPPDRHSPVRFYVLNTSQAILTYGPHPDARLQAFTKLAYEEEELYINPDQESIPVEGTRLGMVMAASELEILFEAVQDIQPPVLGLIDGSLILWGLQSEERSVQATFLGRYLSILGRFREADIPVASYISYPGGQDVVNSLRVSLCSSDPGQCKSCILPLRDRDLCRFLSTSRDRTIFTELLKPGQRSDIFESTSAILERYGDHRVQFFYLNNGDEIVRLESPQWVMRDETKRTLVHGLVLDQCQRSGGYPAYPPVLQEAHEQAVISVEDRRMVEDMVTQALAAQGIIFIPSAKESSKRRRAV